VKISRTVLKTNGSGDRLVEFNCVRVVWNDALAICKQSEKKPKSAELQKIVITQAKKTEERAWLSEVSNIPLQQSVADLEIAFKNFFDSCKGKRKGRKVGYPKFKKRTNSQSARFRIGGFSIKDEGVYLAKIGVVKPIWSRELPTSPSIDAKNMSIGIDLGIKTFAVMSDGTKGIAPCYKGLDRKVRKLQKKLARQQKDSSRRHKTRIQIAKVHNQIADTRKDFLHKLSTKIVSENQTIVLEDLNVSGMVKNCKLSRVISQQGWREFRVLVEGKSDKYGREFVVISRWEPTSQVCSNCDFKWGKIDLSVRSVLCLNCGTEHDRDENASINIEHFGVAQCKKVGIGHCHDYKCTSRQSKTTSAGSELVESVASVDEA